jgi:Tol biopolymer transport system component
LRLSGDARTLVNDPVLVTNDVYGAFAASSSGTVLYVPAIMQTGSLVTVDRTGKVQPIPGGTRIGKAFNPRLSPDGRRIVLVVDGALWVYDFSGKPPIKLSFSGDRFSPLWTPDGMKIVYEADAVDGATLFTIPSDGSSATADVAGPKGHFHPHGWTAEGQLVAARLADGSTDLVRFGPRADAKVEPIQQTPANEGMSASVSPDGKWVAYDASTTGRAEIWVRPLSGPGSAVRVSPEGGYEPVWAKNGRELYYLARDKIMSVAVSMAGSEFSF